MPGWLKFAVAFLLLSSSSYAQQQALPCEQCRIWNAPQAPFRIYGNTYYVGPHGLSSILITSPAGHVLIDGGLPESTSQIEANIHSLGFRIQDVKLIVNSHVHFDHAGGIAELQRLSGAKIVASEWSARVMTKLGIAPDDPQYGVVRPIALVAKVETLSDGQTFEVGDVALTAHLTPGHTPGGTSWTWKSCEGSRCLNIVFGDSLSPVSADGFKFTRTPGAIQGFEKSFAFLRATPCDILLTTHPDASNFWERVEERQKGTKPDPVIDAGACRRLADDAEANLKKRIAAESAR
jgi:metallo-beta-lactamase class B